MNIIIGTPSFVSISGKSWLVEDVIGEANDIQTLSLFILSCISDDAQGERLYVLWDAEIGAVELDTDSWRNIGTGLPDKAEALAAHLSVIRWRSATAADQDLLQASFRANIHAADGKSRSLITLQFRHIDLSGYGRREACSILGRFDEAIALDCLWPGMANQQEALQDIFDKAVDVDQSTLEETERLLRDRLPNILTELKLPTEHSAQKALRDYQNTEGHLHHLCAQ